MTQTIVVLGGAFAGLQIAHRLLKNTRKSVKDLKVILVSKNSHFYWNIASVRAIIPGILKDEEYSQPIEKGFSQYPSDAFEFIVGTAEGADFDAKTVKVATADGERVVSYDHLVLATGTRTAGEDVVPWKANGTHEEVMNTLHKTAEKVTASKHIVVGGAGATGVETAGELGFEFRKNKEIILLCADDQILGGDIVASNAVNELKKLDVTIKTNARVMSTTVLPDGKTEVTLKNGEKISTDLYLPTVGMAPNTEYLPEKVLKDDKFVAIDEFYRVKNATNVWAAGDIVWQPRGGFVIADKQAAGVAKNIDLVLHDKNPTPVKLLPMDVFAAATGRSRGVGRMGSIKLFSYLVYMAKGKTLGLQQLPGILNGTAY
ncbi:putative FAD/NAD(P)-binding domain-containing protein [Seiridium unicorne]|uniref:FAD/NAD(P)-binding domain-containing protein n=1 Tax=Seiridium unicorne TaxID=138068 RepID=A0ABR2UIA8_9PEZI